MNQIINTRLEFFKNQTHPRFWWHKYNNHLPNIYKNLSDNEFEILKEWFIDTEKQSYIGECQIPAISFLTNFINANGIKNIVQCGHYSGYSTLLIAFTLREMNIKNAFITIDIDKKISEYTLSWIKKAGLEDYCKVICDDSANKELLEITNENFQDKPQLIFIDSSHTYNHTLKELDLWYKELKEGGFIFLHDASDFASTFDSSKKGGVTKALGEWTKKNKSNSISLNKIAPLNLSVAIYKDGCGLGIIQKNFKKKDD